MKENVKYYPLTHPQLGIWYTEKLYPGTSIGNIAATLKIKEKIDIGLLEESINLLIKNHDSFRLHFKEIDGKPVQYFSDFNYQKIDFIDFSTDGMESLFRWDTEQTKIPFEISDSDLYYFAIIKVSDNEYGIFSKLHHLICDGWSIVMTGNIVLDYYSKLSGRVETACKKTNKSYIDHIENEHSYMKSERFIKDKKYWNELMSGLSDITSLKKSAANHDMIARRKTYVIPKKFSSKIRQYCKDNKTSIFSLFMASLCMYINRIASKKDIVIGIPVINRSNAKEKETTGMFVSMIALRVTVDENLDFKEFSSKLNNQWYTSLRHQRYPYDLLLKDVRGRNKNIDRLHDISLSYQNAKFVKSSDMIKQEGRWHFCGYQRESLYIHINDREDDGNIILDFDYNTNLFRAKEIEFIYDHISRLLWHALDNPIRKLPYIEMISEKEKQKLLYEFNNTKVDRLCAKTIHEMIERQVIKTPSNIAAVFENQTIKYGELNDRANRLAHYLRYKGVKPNTIVGILMKRSIEMIVAIIAILKAGGTYLPIDPEYPTNRIEYILGDSKAAILITDGYHKHNYNNTYMIIDIYEFLRNDHMDFYTDNIANVNRSKDAAYLIYTSGSTGNPKGVVIEHRSAVNFIGGMTDHIDFSGKTIISLTTNCFDIFFLETVLPLTQGLKIVIANEQQQKLPELLIDTLKHNKVNILQITPTRLQFMLKYIDESDFFEDLTDVLIGGEAFPENIIGKLRRISKANIYNLYGPTETTIWSTVKKVSDSDIINIGKPIRNTQVYILDKYLNLVPIGVQGSLYIGGEGLARGYYRNSELTSKKFIDNPFIRGEKIYNTGDLARWYPQGEIQCLGRIDNQVKINGFRVELDEIEQKLISILHIKDAAVAVKMNRDGNNYLCAYIVEKEQINESDIKKCLLSVLPYYMVPTSFVYLDELPTTPNGKLNRFALPEPVDNKKLAYEEGRNDLDNLLIDLWKVLFAKNQISISDNFFDLGGDSLKIIQLQSYLFKYKITINTQDIYNYQTIKELTDILTLRNKNLPNNSYQVSDISLQDILDDREISIDNRTYNILLTGSTGYLGIHLLDNLLQKTNSIIYCLVRGESQKDTEQRLEKLLTHYFPNKHSSSIGNRIHVVNGDISKERLGLDEKLHEKLLKDIDVVINCSAIVKHYGFYEDFYKTNVYGTQNIIHFCMDGNKCLHHISTTAIAGNHLNKNTEVQKFTENDFYIGQSYENNVYSKSKFEAEQLIYKNISNGLRAAVYRVGILTGRYSDGLFQVNISENGMYRRIKSIIELGFISENLKYQSIEFTPVDYCASAIVSLMKISINQCRIYHLINHNRIQVNKLVQVLNSVGYIIEYKKDILEGITNHKTLLGIVNDIKGNELSFEESIRIDSQQTADVLSNLGFFWPIINREYIIKLISHMESVDFLNKEIINAKNDRLG